MADLAACRREIDRIDTQIMELFKERMAVTTEVAAFKAAHGKAVLDRTRERANIERAASMVPPELASYAAVIETVLMEASRDAQHRLLHDRSSETADRIRTALAAQPAFFPLRADVACQGVEGAYQQIAIDRVFRHANIAYQDSFEGVIEAVASGACEFGMLPLENSTAGSVNRVYDLMRSHDFHIVRSCRLMIDHNLLALPSTRLEDLRIVYSHEQAIRQCAGFLARIPHASVHICENTAKAAEKVAQLGRTDVAAIASRDCARLYGLDILRHSVQDQSNNYTRFACIARDLTIYPGADRASLVVTLDHEPGSLYKMLAKFYALDINLIKLESRPIPQRAFEFRFYFDIECPAAAPQFLTLIDSIEDACEDFRYLGSYQEVV